MHVQHSQVALARSGTKPLKNEFPRPGDIPQSEIFGWRTHEDKIVVLSVVQREQTATLYLQLLIKENENVVELMHRQHFPHACVMIKD